MHDCALLMERIEAMCGRPGLLDEAQAGELGTYVVNTEQEPWKVYRIASGAEEILDLFTQPRRCGEVSRIVRTATDGEAIDFGVLRRADPRPDHRAERRSPVLVRLSASQPLPR